MTNKLHFWLTREQEIHLDAWSTVYVEAKLQERLGISLSCFLKDPGEYLVLSCLQGFEKTTPSPEALPSWKTTRSCIKPQRT
jgi:hypothetical protein